MSLILLSTWSTWMDNFERKIEMWFPILLPWYFCWKFVQILTQDKTGPRAKSRCPNPSFCSVPRTGRSEPSHIRPPSRATWSVSTRGKLTLYYINGRLSSFFNFLIDCWIWMFLKVLVHAVNVRHEKCLICVVVVSDLDVEFYIFPPIHI